MLKSAGEVLARYVRRFGAETVLARLRRRRIVAAKTVEESRVITGRPPIDDSAVVEQWERHMRDDPDLADRSTFRKVRRAITEAARRAF